MQGKAMGNPYYVTYNNGKPTPVAYQRTFYTNNQSNNTTSGISRDAPEVYDVTGGQYSCGRERDNNNLVSSSNMSWVIDNDQDFALFVLGSAVLIAGSTLGVAAVYNLAVIAAPATFGASVVIATAVLMGLSEAGISIATNIASLIQGIQLYNTNGYLEISFKQINSVEDFADILISGPLVIG